MGIKFSLNPEKEKKIPEEFKDLAKDFAEKGFITTSSENLINSSNEFNEIVFFKLTIFSLFFLIIFSRTFSAILDFF